MGSSQRRTDAFLLVVIIVILSGPIVEALVRASLR